jgi:hypothetical protein
MSCRLASVAPSRRFVGARGSGIGRNPAGRPAGQEADPRSRPTAGDRAPANGRAAAANEALPPSQGGIDTWLTGLWSTKTSVLLFGTPTSRYPSRWPR